jgi:hypothetical protein
MARSLTAADAVITIAVVGLFSTPQQLQGFATDNVYDVGVQSVAETAMGVDGKLSAGFVFNPIDQTFTLQADSLSNDLFDTWVAAQQQGKTVFRCSGRTTLPAVGKSYVSNNGALVSFPPLPTAGKILQPRKFLIRWESIVGTPI